MSPGISRLARHGIRIGFAAVMIAAALPKIMDPSGFAWALARHRIVPEAWVGVLAVGLPWLELSAAIAAVAVRGLRRGAMAVGTVLLSGFAVAIAANLALGLAVPCGCFGISADAAPAGWGHVAANFVGAVLCGWTAGRRSDK